MAVMLPAGQGMQFKRDMASLLADLQKSIPAVFESRRYIEQRKSMLEHFQDRQRSVLKDFEKKVKEKGFEVVQVQGADQPRPEIAPVVDGNPVGLDQMQAKVDAGRSPGTSCRPCSPEQAELEAQMDIVMREMRNIERRAKKSLEDLTHKIIVPVVEELLEDIRSRYPNERPPEFLVELEKNILDNLSRFQQREEQQPSVLGIQLPKEEDGFLEYQVNVIVDNAREQGVPVIIEKNPRYKNLFGTIERVVDRNGVWRTDFTHIKAGSIVKADGGYLVLNALDALTEPGVWVTLKRVLRNRQIEIQPIESGLLGASSALKPEPIDLNVKVIMIGDPSMYQLLYGLRRRLQGDLQDPRGFRHRDAEQPELDQQLPLVHQGDLRPGASPVVRPRGGGRGHRVRRAARRPAEQALHPVPHARRRAARGELLDAPAKAPPA